VHLNPKAGLGVAVGTGLMFPVRAPDPAGGPDWGLRLVRTSRGYGCVQVGRVVDGRLGVLGRDGAFGNDGKFHELGAEVLGLADCQLADGAGHVFSAMSYIGMPDSADPTSCSPPLAPTSDRGVCPRPSLRNVYYGLLGPQAEAVTYVGVSGAVVREPVSGPEGAYIVVVRTDPRRPNIGYFVPGVTPGIGLHSVEYRDGTVCHIVSARRLGGARDCPLKGFVPPKLPHVTSADVAAPIHVTVGDRPEQPHLGVKPPRGAPPIPAQRAVTVSFRARRAANARSFYTISSDVLHHAPGCPGDSTFGPIAKDVAAGGIVRQTLYFAYNCPGTVRIVVGYAQQHRPTAMPYEITGRGNVRVGRAVVKLP
jgi:hypothetical protein